jgi:hypothetical protein
VYELLTYLRSDKGAEFILHHLVVIVTYGLVLYCGEMHFWAAWAGTVEATNPSLCILQLGLLSGIGARLATTPPCPHFSRAAIRPEGCRFSKPAFIRRTHTKAVSVFLFSFLDYDFCPRRGRLLFRPRVSRVPSAPLPQPSSPGTVAQAWLPSSLRCLPGIGFPSTPNIYKYKNNT